MKNRRSFLAAVASGGAALSLAKPSVAAGPSPSASPAASAKPPSAPATAFALSMRRFDATLSDAELQTIAKAIDVNNAAAQVLNPKKKRLPNALAPAVRFAVDAAP